MNNNKFKKRRTFIDLSDDIFENNLETQEQLEPQSFEQPIKQQIETNNFVSKKTIKSNKQSENNFEIEKNRKIQEKTIVHNAEKEPTKIQQTRKVAINESFEIFSEESLDKGFHFYSNDRVMNKVKKLAKEKNIKLSKLITMILDKAIKEE